MIRPTIFCSFALCTALFAQSAAPASTKQAPVPLHHSRQTRHPSPFLLTIVQAVLPDALALITAWSGALTDFR